MTKATGAKLKRMFRMGPKATVDGKEYLQSDLTPQCMTMIAAAQAAQNTLADLQQKALIAQAAVLTLTAEVRNLLPAATPPPEKKAE